MPCRLVCVPPAQAAAIWPHVSPLIEAAMKRGGLSAFAPVRDDVLAGRALLWLAINDGAVRAAAVSKIAETEWRRVCVLVACGGADRRRWLQLLGQIEQYAKITGCAAMRIMGRKGWARVLPGYRVTRIVIEKELK